MSILTYLLGVLLVGLGVMFYFIFRRPIDLTIPSRGQIISKPWGFEEIWANRHPYVGKILHINHGHQLSLQYHRRKVETLRVLSGVLTLTVSNGTESKIYTLEKGQTYHLEPYVIHRMAAPNGSVEVLEVSTSEVWDVIRLQDDYERVKK